MTDDAANEPHVPTEAERAARVRVREHATGMSHHEAAEALEAAERELGQSEEAAGEAGEEAPGKPSGEGGPERSYGAARAAVAEWRRITELLFDHGGPYSPDTDAFVQGQLTARAAHGHPKYDLGRP
ncbi:hypothetical protein J7E97_23880 [Streptomyces sp. ISL-66]|uniref:hypothetical protein n=1 Tax=Streptomyces sp. ISL-66 TaxID=2819186 RepID=UPI001BEBA6B8|nr:hypothetical protein [Streptomyces sp. ISL-66]MBT2470822.1 hypothetical protein [Streptomyces sp. ISL-66]